MFGLVGDVSEMMFHWHFGRQELQLVQLRVDNVYLIESCDTVRPGTNSEISTITTRCNEP